MKKKTIIAVLVVAIVALLAVLLFLQNQTRRNEALQTPAPAPAAAPASNAPAPATPEAAAQTPQQTASEQPAVDASSEGAVEKMLPVIDVAVRVMYEQNIGYYAMESSELQWEVLARLCAANAWNDPSIEKKDGAVRVPAETMKKLAAACFASLGELQEIPESIKNVEWNSAEGMYIIKEAKTDKADELKTEIIETLPLHENGYTVYVALVSPTDEKRPLLSTYSFDLMPYTMESGAEGMLFPLCVFNAYDSCNVLAQIQGIEEKDGKLMLSLHHVQLHWQVDEEDSEIYTPLIVADTKSDATLPLFAKDAVDWNTIGMVISGEDQGFKNADEAIAWFKEHYTEKVLEENVIYQMRVYEGVIYSAAPLYAFYFQG